MTLAETEWRDCCADNGMSFERILFYGHEVRLIIFLLLTFAIIDFISGNFVLDGILTCIIDGVSV